jgi:hypothetical protein
LLPQGSGNEQGSGNNAWRRDRWGWVGGQEKEDGEDDVLFEFFVKVSTLQEKWHIILFSYLRVLRLREGEKEERRRGWEEFPF